MSPFSTEGKQKRKMKCGFIFFFLTNEAVIEKGKKIFQKFLFYRPFFRSLFKTDNVCELLASILIQQADIFK